MISYDPERQPNPERWLAADEGDRIHAIEKWHRRARIRQPSQRAHAIFHAIVENQIAENLESVVWAVPRLAAQGLCRHDAVHAVAWVLAAYIQELLSSQDDPNAPVEARARYTAVVERLTAQAWLEQKMP